MSPVTVVCDAVLAECVCTEGDGHGGPHVCRCGGSWRGDDRDGSEIEVVHLPQWIIGPGPESVNHSGFMVVQWPDDILKESLSVGPGEAST